MQMNMGYFIHCQTLIGYQTGYVKFMLGNRGKILFGPISYSKMFETNYLPHLILAILIFWNTCNEIQPSLKELGEGINQKPRNLEISK
jgi:hypothetical protein